MAHISREELLERLQAATAVVTVGKYYKHTKSGGRYKVLGLGIDEKAEKVQVQYQEIDHDPPITWHRHFDGEDGWITPTEIDGKPAPRFTFIGDSV
ncbi:hypothetical protein A2872_00215 [Candidatus Gottesmanbacteria bacterium RIFCSPHIGHO2_01_FULL_42_12]|uniref:DUF1653 domain-containing protein n=1 Tax=Candidatus Gottesmanbacteria bacterium RIFCSPHIGHO2_01_FULL_42_12 TaxID=1798377 RepID=A0A1F5YZG9_9BACT|nr:MAG: hypothetical protein A2872_00215 [Candidatus Gottesmanbacteria bacterium RIFCSPHIGHO2_01_FULL_42_12]